MGTTDTCVKRAFIVAFYIARALVMVLGWPIWMLIARFKSDWTYAIASPQEKFNIKAKTEEDLAASARAQIIEVAIESSFQPLLQLYLLLPMLLMQLSCPARDILELISVDGVYTSSYRIQFWSIVTSIISLSWSFTFYQAVQKKGALDFGSNPAGRFTLFFSNLMQITSRLFAFVLYAYTFKDGNFWPMIATLVLHILIMSLLHFLTSDEWTLDTFRNRNTKIGYHCLINGICNLYLHNWIGHIKGKEAGRKILIKKAGTSFRQVVFDLIFVLENTIIVIMAFIYLVEYLPSSLFLFVLLTQYFGVCLKWLYYLKFHIWKNTFTLKKVIQSLKRPVKSSFCNAADPESAMPNVASGETVVIETESRTPPEPNKQIVKTVDEPKYESSIKRKKEPSSTRKETLTPLSPILPEEKSPEPNITTKEQVVIETKPSTSPKVKEQIVKIVPEVESLDTNVMRGETVVTVVIEAEPSTNYEVDKQIFKTVHEHKGNVLIEQEGDPSCTNEEEMIPLLPMAPQEYVHQQ